MHQINDLFYCNNSNMQKKSARILQIQTLILMVITSRFLFPQERYFQI